MTTSHVGNGEHDFEDMEVFSDKDKEDIKQVRMLAREIINMLEPRHINTYARLLEIIADAQQRAKSAYFLQNPGRPTLEQKEPYRFFGQNIRDAIRVLRGK